MIRDWMISIAMLVTAVLSFKLKPGVDPQSELRAAVPLEQLFPVLVEQWRVDMNAAAPVRPAFERARQFQMYDQVLERTYVNSEGYRIMLSVAYGRQQSVGLQMHRPEVCYKAGGFSVTSVQVATLPIFGAQFPVNRLFANMEGRPEPITYWRLLGNEVVFDELRFKMKQLKVRAQGLPDGMLVRVSSIDADRDRAFNQQAMFVQNLASSLDGVQRMRIFGQY